MHNGFVGSHRKPSMGALPPPFSMDIVIHASLLLLSMLGRCRLRS